MRTIEEIQIELAKINARNKEIGELSSRAAQGEEIEGYDSEALNKEVDLNLENRAKLEAELLAIRSSIKEFEPVVKKQKEEGEKVRKMSKYDSLEYRNAFMNFILTGEKNKILKREDAFTVQSDVATVIVPTVITSQLFKKDTNVGALYDVVNKTSYPFGMNVKVSSTEFEIEWVAERDTTEKKKATTNEINFTGFKGLIKFAQSFETTITTLQEFESAMLEKMKEGARKSFDKAIVLGAGTTAPKGFLRDGVYTGAGAKAVKVTDATVSEYKTWIGILAKAPLGKNVTLVINNSDWLTYILGMTNEIGTPIAVERAGVNGMPSRTFLGRPVIVLENQSLPTYAEVSGNATASVATAFAAFVDLNDYYLNLNKDMTMRKYIDEDTDDVISKLIVMADGKMADITSIVPVCKGA